MHLIELELISNTAPLTKLNLHSSCILAVSKPPNIVTIADSPANPNEGLIEGAGMLSSYVNRNISSAKSIPLLLKNILAGPELLAGVVQNEREADFQLALTVQVLSDCNINLQVRSKESKIFVPENVTTVFPFTGPLLGDIIFKDKVAQNVK